MDYKTFYDRVGELVGWDFSRLKCSSEGETWDFYNEVVNVSHKTDILLDIGTGGGERILKIAQNFMMVVGIDISDGMVNSAQNNLVNSDVPNVKIIKMDSNSIQFPEAFFNIISCRHAPFEAYEVRRLMASGGIFLTQQVSEGDKLNIKQAFGRGQAIGEKDGQLKGKYVKALMESGFREVHTFDYDAKEYYQTPEDLIFLLKYTPIIPDFGKSKGDFEVLDAFIKQTKMNKGIVTNSKRFMIIAKV
jgi:hypothetical protein